MSKESVNIVSMGVQGEGVGELADGRKVFVPDALPGEEVELELTLEKKSYAKGVLREVVQASPHRIEPPCPYYGQCGGCQVQHASYEYQLTLKRQRVLDAFERIGKLTVEIAPCEPSPQPYGYRNKIQLAVVGGKVGMFARGSRDLVPIDKCLIHCPLGEEVLPSLLPLIDDQTRYLVLRTAIHTQEVLAMLVTRGEVKAPRLTHPSIIGLIENRNRDPGNRVLGPKFRCVAGREYLEEILMGLKLRMGAASFFQVNTWQAEKLYAKALELAEPAGKRVLDAYCGIGAMSLLAAKAGGEVSGIEMVEEAIANAKSNASLNGLQADFHCAKVEEGAKHFKGQDVVILNPPRKGCEPAVIEQLIAQKIRRVVYVSCDPATLARDLSRLQEGGYTIGKAYPFDLFPQTAHVETVVSCEMG